ncbi:MAG: hypothetical protein MJ201_02095 [Mycoplasmoidaceae bacterium]|nr:hypothetical protein [Mycoplasmoidaceae bacterium]
MGQTLNFTATSDNASLTLKCEGASSDQYVYYCYDYEYDLADGVSVHDFEKDIAIPIEKGHTLCVFAGDQTEPDNLMPFSYSDQDYRHFKITGDI